MRPIPGTDEGCRRLVRLLLVTARYPHAEAHEFLHDEVRFLAERFDSIVVAPMRPQGPQSDHLPRSVTVDHSLAEQLSRTRLQPPEPLRLLEAARRATRKNRAGVGWSRNDLRMDWRGPGWARSALTRRIDCATVELWARQAQEPDLAYTFWLGAATVGLRNAWPDLPIVSRVHGGDLFAEAHRWHSIPYQREALASASLVASVSESGRGYLADKFPEQQDKVVWRRLGIRDLGEPNPALSSSSIRLLSVSSIDDNKRVGLIAEVALLLARMQADVQWTHLGDGPGRHAVERILQRGTTVLRADLRGQVDMGAVYRELTSGMHSVFVNLSLSEGAPMSLMEAQCCGLPVVATAVGGTPEVVPARLNEFVSPTDGAQQIAEAVLRAHARPAAERSDRRSNWRQHYEATSNYTAWAGELAAMAQRAQTGAT
jgi:colanic acid/amylovoran biosynthesis glycosyltransferase